MYARSTMLRCAAARRLGTPPPATQQLPVILPTVHVVAGSPETSPADISSPHTARAGIGEAPIPRALSGIGDTGTPVCAVCQLAGPEDVPPGIGELLGATPGEAAAAAEAPGVAPQCAEVPGAVG